MTNNAELPIDEARAKLNEHKRSLQKGGEVDTPGLDSAASTTCDALPKAGPSQGFDSIGLVQDLMLFASELSTCTPQDDIKAVMIKAGSAKRLIDSLLASVKVAVSDLNGARANFKRLETDRAAAAEKRRREVEAGEEGTPAKKRVLHVKVATLHWRTGVRM